MSIDNRFLKIIVKLNILFYLKKEIPLLSIETFVRSSYFPLFKILK